MIIVYRKVIPSLYFNSTSLQHFLETQTDPPLNETNPNINETNLLQHEHYFTVPLQNI